MKHLLTIFLSLSFYLLNAQTIHVYEPKDEKVVKPKEPNVKKTNVVVPKKLKVDVVPKYALSLVINGFVEDNMYPIYDLNTKNSKYGYIDTLGQIKLPLQYDEAEEFSNGLAAVMKKNKWGYIDKKGNTVIPFSINDVSFLRPGKFYKGVAPIFNENEEWGLINKSNVKVIDFIYYRILDFVNNFAIVCIKIESDVKYGFIDTVGKEISSLYYDDVNNFNEGVAQVCKNNECGFINENGKIIIPIKYNSLVYRSDCNDKMQEGLIPVSDYKKIGFVNSKNDLIIPIEFDQDVPKSDLDGKYGFINGVSIAGKNKKWGFINKNGDEVIPFKYDGVSYFYNNRAKVLRVDPTGNKKYGFIDNKGFEVIPIIYDRIFGSESFRDESYVDVRLNGIQFKIDINGNRLK